MLILALLGIATYSDLPRQADLRQGYDRYGLSVCQQNGPLCWDYTLVGLLEYELANNQHSATRLSPGYLAWAATATDSESRAGSNFGRAYRGLERYGIAPLQMGGEPDQAGHGQVPSEGTLNAASGLGRIDVHWIRFWNSQDRLTPDQLRAIETEIAGGHPVAVGMRWPNRTTFTPRQSHTLTVPAPNDVFDGHCVALVGYQMEPRLPGGGAFLFRNSWGTEWADHGYAWMPFELLNFCINDSLSVRVAPPIPVAGPGTLEFGAADLAVKALGGPLPILQGNRGRQHLFFGATNVGDHFVVDLPVEKAGIYELRLTITRAEDYGIFRVQLGGTATTIDGSGPGVSRSNPLPCGKVRLRKGSNRMDITAIGHDSASTGLSIGIDSLQLVP